MKGKFIRFISFMLCVLMVGKVCAQTADDLKLTHNRNFVICNDAGTAFKTNVTNETTHTGFKADGFKIKLGDAGGTVYEGLQPGGQRAITYNVAGYYTLTFSGVTTEGKTLERTYKVVVAGLPKIDLQKQDKDVKCLGTEVIYNVNIYDQNLSGTKYTLDYDDGTPPDVMTNDELRAAGGKFKHKFMQSYCNMSDRPEQNNKFFNVKLTVKNECYDDAAYVQEYVAVPFDAAYTFSHIGQNKVCTYENVSLRNISGGGMLSDCNYGDRFALWDFGNNKTSEEWAPYIKYEEAKNYKIKLTVSNMYPCATDSTEQEVVLINRMVAAFTMAKDTVCGEDIVEFKNHSSGDDLKTIRWTIIPLDGTPVPSYTENDWNPKVIFRYAGRYKVKLYVENDCSHDEADITIVVKQNPGIIRFNIPKEICPPRLDLAAYISVVWNRNPEKPEWTIAREGAVANTGFTCMPGAGLTSTYPKIDFETPGKYSIRLKLPDVGCGGTLLDTTVQLIVHDPHIHTDITTTQLNICESGVINFTNRSVGENLKYEWIVKPAANVKFIGGTRPDMSEPVLQFSKYGDYDVTLHLTTAMGCGSDDTTFRVHVKKDPAIFFFEPPEAVCPGGSYMLNFRGSVDYLFYNNVKKVKWNIAPLDGNFEFKNETTADSLYPVIQFNASGVYSFTVKIEPAGCPEAGAGAMELTRTIRVRNSAMTMSAVADDSLVCEGQERLFNIKAETGDGDPLIYAWNILPSDGNYEFKDFGNDKKIAKIQFNHWGTYQVRGVASGYCGSLDSTFRITVQKEPEVRLKDTTGICPGLIDMANYAGYQWYNNKKEVSWKITPVDINTPADGFELSGEHAEYPTINFKSKGEYKVQTELTSYTIGCTEGFLKDITTYVVYDTTIVVDVTADRTDVCEDDQVYFRNVSTGVGLAFNWTVTGQVDGWEYVGNTSANSQNPIMRFIKNGEYDVTVFITGTCNHKQKSFHITVRGVPEIEFSPKMNKICSGAAAQDMALYVNYKDRKNSTITPHWSIEPAIGYTFEEDYGADSDLPRINFTDNAHYKVTLTAASQCVAVPQVYTAEIDVIRNEAKPLFNMPQEACTPADIPIDNVSQGDSLTYTWTIHPATGWSFVAGDGLHSKKPHLVFTELGSFEVTLGIQNICYGEPLTVKDTIRTYAVPEITFGDIDKVCETYVLVTADTVRVDYNNDSLRRVKWSVTPPVPGFVDSDSFPKISLPHGDYQVKAEFWNGCAAPGVAEFSVSVDEFIPIQAIPNDTLCNLVPALPLEALPVGGKWTLVGAEDMLKAEGGATMFNPLRPGEYELVYSFTNGSCTATNTKKIKVHPLPVVEAGNNLEICLNHDPKVLVGLPAGGWWEGDGVVTPVFTPRLPGDVELTYYYKDQHQCLNQDSTIMTVHPLPDTVFVSKEQYCRGIEAEFIPRSPEKECIWNYGDHTKLDSVPGTGKHVYENHGWYDVSLIAVSVHGCLDTSEVRAVEVVNDAPPAVFTLDKHAECGPEVKVKISLRADDYVDPNLHFAWDFGNGQTAEDLLPANPQTYLTGLWDTTYYIKFRVFNICNETNMADSVLIGSVPEVGLTFQHKWNCSPLNLKVKNISTGNGNRYTWYMGDGDKFENVYEPAEHLYEANEGTKIFYVSLVAENNCGKDSVAKALTVLPKSLGAFFETPKTNICVGEEICFTNQTTDTARYVTYKYWDFGDEVRDTTWDACHIYKEGGKFKVLLYVDNGCGFDTISDQINVLPLPEISIGSEDIRCDQDTFHFSFRSDQDLQWWQWNLGDATKTEERSLAYTYRAPGKFSVTLDVISRNIAFCKAHFQKEVVVNPLPDLSITPFDTLVCPAWLYEPKVTGVASLMWDYGDGSELTSSMQHLYDNQTNSVLRHQVILYAKTDLGCSKEYRGAVSVANLPVADMRIDVTRGRPQKVDLINLSRDYSECIWFLPPDREDHTFSNRHLEFKENGRYVFSLVTLNEFGCKDSLALEHEVLMRGLYFPNTFIPHSLNGKISCFNGIGMGLQRYKLEIFDQYGNKIWETQALQTGKPSEGWNGCNMKGEQMAQGTYIWRAEAIFADDDVWTGRNNESGVPETTQGTVLLLRE